MSSNTRRRIDQVTDPSVPERIPEMSTGEVRSLRDAARAEELRLSYVRRLLHGRLDIANAEVSRRGGDGDELIAQLPRILAGDGGQASGQPRALGFYAPGSGRGSRAEDRLLDDVALSQLPELSDEEVRDFLAELAGVEERVSSQRRVVLDHLDALQAELVSRYRDGRARIDEILSTQSDVPASPPVSSPATGEGADTDGHPGWGGPSGPDGQARSGGGG